MGQPYVGEIRMVGFNFAPNGWMLCQGQLLPISENEVLFQLIGTTYGGDGETTFALPNLQSRIPVHQGTLNGTTYQIGEMAGTETVTLTTQQIPSHNHTANGNTSSGGQGTPQNGIWANPGQAVYGGQPGTLQMKSGLIGLTGGSQPHENMMPYLTINFAISLFGIFPSQS